MQYDGAGQQGPRKDTDVDDGSRAGDRVSYSYRDIEVLAVAFAAEATLKNTCDDDDDDDDDERCSMFGRLAFSVAGPAAACNSLPVYTSEIRQNPSTVFVVI